MKNNTSGARIDVPLGCIGFIFRGLWFAHIADIGGKDLVRVGAKQRCGNETASGGNNLADNKDRDIRSCSALVSSIINVCHI